MIFKYTRFFYFLYCIILFLQYIRTHLYDVYIYVYKTPYLYSFSYIGCFDMIWGTNGNMVPSDRYLYLCLQI
jgi:hypothetical protein